MKKEKNIPKAILILAANPKDTQRLRLDKEVDEIQARLERASHREHFVIHQKWAMQAGGIRQALLDSSPQIVHFCGHGEPDGLIVEGWNGKTALVSPDALADLFRLCKDDLECVLLNVCHSEPMAEAVNQHIEYVIGMREGIGDEAAIEFSVGFYDAMGAGKSVEEAFDFGRNAIQLKGIPEHLIPVLKKKTTAQVQLILEEITDFNETSRKNLVGILAAVLEIDKGAVRISQVISGSVKVIVELPADKCQEMILLFDERSERLAPLMEQFNVKEIKFMEAVKAVSQKDDKSDGEHSHVREIHSDDNEKQPLMNLIAAFLALIVLTGAIIGGVYLIRDALFPVFIHYSKLFGTFIIYIGLVMISLIAAIVLFGILQATGLFKKTGQKSQYEFGGAMAGFLAISMFLIGTFPFQSPMPIEINGNVRFVENGAPVSIVSGARVSLSSLSGFETRTNDIGNFRLRLPENQQLQEIELQITYKTRTYFHTVQRSEMENVTIEITKLRPEISGSVRFVENGKPVGPVSGAEIALSGFPGFETKTDDNGNFTLQLPENLQVQEIEIQVTYNSKTSYHIVQRSQMDNVIIEITRAIPKISGSVRFEKDDKPVSGANIAMSDFPEFETETDRYGNFTLRLPENHPADQTEVVITYDGRCCYHTIQLSEAENAVIRIEKAEPFKPKTWTESETGMEFVRIPGGCYQMGCDDQDCEDYEKPAHCVCVDGFWMGAYEVTQGHWKRIMGNSPSAFRTDDNHPAMISWDKTQEFIRDLNKKTGGDFRLPTEAEWEYVCRQVGKIHIDGTHISDNKKKSAYPLDIKIFNMLKSSINNGNYEWCRDIYSADAYASHPVSNPLYKGSGSGRAVRGVKHQSCTYRFSSPPDKGSNNIGFRVIKPDPG